MNEKILMILFNMEQYMPGGESLLVFLYQHKKMFRFPLTLSKADMEQDIEILDLSVRSVHCLKRAGYNTLGSLVHAIVDKPEETSKRQLLRIRSLGQHSADEIMMTLFCYQLRSLPDKEKTEYLAEVLKMNAA